MEFQSSPGKAIARPASLCELYCPEDALYVSPFADEAQSIDVVALKQADAMGSYRRAVGWTDDTRNRRAVDRSYCCLVIDLGAIPGDQRHAPIGLTG